MTHRFSFDPSERIKSPKDFKRCQQKGYRHVTRHFKIFIIKSDQPQARFGVVVSKAVGNAVVRNQWKRKLRESFRLSKHSWKQACDIVVLVRAQDAPPPLRVVQNELDRELSTR